MSLGRPNDAAFFYPILLSISFVVATAGVRYQMPCQKKSRGMDEIRFFVSHDNVTYNKTNEVIILHN